MDCLKFNFDETQANWQEVSGKMDLCEANCTNYYNCDKIAALGDRLKELED